jgi:hypothetical protein
MVLNTFHKVRQYHVNGPINHSQTCSSKVNEQTNQAEEVDEPETNSERSRDLQLSYPAAPLGTRTAEFGSVKNKPRHAA